MTTNTFTPAFGPEAVVEEAIIVEQGDSRTDTMFPLPGFNVKSIMDRFNSTCMSKGCDEQRVTGPGNKTISRYCHSHRHMENPTKEETKSTNKEKMTMKSTVNKVKGFDYKKAGSTVWASIKKGTSTVLGLLNKNKMNIFIGSSAVAIGGMFTSTICGAAVAGIALCGIATLLVAVLSKKKEEGKAKKALHSFLVSSATVVSLPFVLFVAAYVGLYATVYGAILPYSIIVA